MPSDPNHSPSRPRLRLVDDTPPEPKWSGRRRVFVMVALGALVWIAAAGAAWLLARLLA